MVIIILVRYMIYYQIFIIQVLNIFTGGDVFVFVSDENVIIF